MPDPADPNGQHRRSRVLMLLLMLAMLLVGMGGMAWLFHRFDTLAQLVKPSPPVIVPPAPPRQPPLVDVAPPPPAAIVATIVERRIEQIEEKVDDISERTERATSEAQRAEALLVAFAARRAIDRGTPLGYLEAVLRDRFGTTEPQAVATVISVSRQPVTIDALRDQFAAIEPQLAVPASEDGWWETFRRELASLIVIRDAGVSANPPVDRVKRARDSLATGQVDSALAEVARLPRSAAATGWIADARRYVQVRAALDRIESAALLQPAPPRQ